MTTADQKTDILRSRRVGCVGSKVLAGRMEEPNKTYLIACSPFSRNPKSSNICTIVDDCLKEMGITREMFLLLLSDAAKYMLKAGDTLKIMYQRMLHVTCTAHLLHNCAGHIRAHFKATDNLISSIKAVTIKNKDRRSLFAAAGLSAPPQPMGHDGAHGWRHRFSMRKTLRLSSR